MSRADLGGASETLMFVALAPSTGPPLQRNLFNSMLQSNDDNQNEK
jgi:hypothetical protein